MNAAETNHETTTFGWVWAGCWFVTYSGPHLFVIQYLGIHLFVDFDVEQNSKLFMENQLFVFLTTKHKKPSICMCFLQLSSFAVCLCFFVCPLEFIHKANHFYEKVKTLQLKHVFFSSLCQFSCWMLRQKHRGCHTALLLILWILALTGDE